jgi:hypothetical protein
VFCWFFFYIHQEYLSVTFMFQCILIWFQWCWPYKSSEVVFPPPFSWTIQEEVVLIPLYLVKLSSEMKCEASLFGRISIPEIFLNVRLFIIDSISLLIAVLFRFLFLHYSVLVDCLCLGIYPFLLGFPICWCIVILNYLNSFVFLGYQL